MSFLGRRRGKKSRVWGYYPEDLTLIFEGENLQGLVSPYANIDSVVIRPCLGTDHLRVEAVRRANREWLEPWEATLPAESDEDLPSWNEYPKLSDQRMFDGQTLAMIVEVNDEIAGLVTLGAVEKGAMSLGILGYWIAQKWAGRGVTSLAAAATIDLIIFKLGLHRVEVNVRPENVPSLKLCRKLGLREEGYKTRYMNINGRWSDHLAFAVDREMLGPRTLVESRIRREEH